MKIGIVFFAMALTAFVLAPAHAQSTVTPSTPPSPDAFSNSAARAVDTAKDGIDASVRDHLVSVYGIGTPVAIQTWWVIFYDPSVPSHGRAVKVEGGQITKVYEAKGGVTYLKALTFPRSRVTGEGSALRATQNYAAEHAIAYDQVRALLRLTTEKQDLRWRVELLSGPDNKGFVFTDASDGAFAMYAPPGSQPAGTSGGTGGGLVGDAKKVGNDVKNTFLNIGGDLQEFFTGDRTVDQ
jgi:hypothetical protein